MKNVKQILVILIVTTLSCDLSEAQKIFGNKNVISQERKVPDFSGVKVCCGIDLYISQGNAIKLVVEADENLHDIIITEVTNGKLKIYVKPEFRIKSSTSMKVHLTVKEINSLSGSSGSDIISKTVIKSDKLDLRVSSGSDLRIEVETNELTCEASSGSDAVLSGSTNKLWIDSSSGSDVDAYDLISKTCTVESSSGSDVNVNVTDELVVRASSGSDVNYKGNPQIDAKLSSGGDVNSR